jgi:hypothetical protein
VFSGEGQQNMRMRKSTLLELDDPHETGTPTDLPMVHKQVLS